MPYGNHSRHEGVKEKKESGLSHISRPQLIALDDLTGCAVLEAQVVATSSQFDADWLISPVVDQFHDHADVNAEVGAQSAQQTAQP